MCKKNQTFSGSGLGMKWHKFLLILIWLGAALNIVSGIGYAFGGSFSTANSAQKSMRQFLHLQPSTSLVALQ